jgi:ectoine hydroxylase-related dioxygenase (phytanoyl-CoA dioxygenase family)
VWVHAGSTTGLDGHAAGDGSARAFGARFSACRPDWFGGALRSVRRDGFAIVEDVLSRDVLERTRNAMYRVHERILAEIGPQRLARAGELGALRLMLRYDAHFYSLLELDDVLAIVDASLSSAAVLHVQNGLIAPPAGGPFGSPSRAMLRRDFPHHLDGYVASLTTVLAIGDFTADNGAPLLVPGSHREEHAPSPERMLDAALPAVAPAGSMVVLDGGLWHAPGTNRSGHDRLAITQQFTRSFIRPQVDYMRALGDEMVRRRDQRTQQLLGRYTRAVASVDECYPPGS